MLVGVAHNPRLGNAAVEEIAKIPMRITDSCIYPFAKSYHLSALAAASGLDTDWAASSRIPGAGDIGWHLLAPLDL